MSENNIVIRLCAEHKCSATSLAVSVRRSTVGTKAYNSVWRSLRHFASMSFSDRQEIIQSVVGNINRSSAAVVCDE